MLTIKLNKNTGIPSHSQRNEYDRENENLEMQLRTWTKFLQLITDHEAEDRSEN